MSHEQFPKKYITKLSDLKEGMNIMCDNPHYSGYKYEIVTVENRGYTNVYAEEISSNNWVLANSRVPYEIEDVISMKFYEMIGGYSDDDIEEEELEDKPLEKPKNPCECSAFYGQLPTMKEAHSDWCPMYRSYRISEEYDAWLIKYKIWEINNTK